LNYTAQAIAMSGHGLQFEDMLPTNCKITEWTEWSDCSGKTNFVEQKVLNKNFKVFFLKSFRMWQDRCEF